MSKSNPLILVVGATGRFAGPVVPELKKRGAIVRALLRDKSKKARVRKRGASQIVTGDLRNRSSLDAAPKDVDGVFYIGPALQNDETQMGINMVEAASTAGVKTFAFSSVAHIAADLEHHTAKLPVERAIFESGMEYTILRPTFFYQNFAAQWNKVIRTGVLAVPYSIKSLFSAVDCREVTEVAAMALTSEGDEFAYGIFNLCGDGNFSYETIAELMGQVSGQPIGAKRISLAEWASNVGLPTGSNEWKLLEAMFKYYDDHGLPGNNITLRALLEREPRRLKDYFRELGSS